MEVTRGNDGSNEEKDTDPAVDSRARDLVHDGLAQGADQGQAIADEIELGDLDTPGQELEQRDIGSLFPVEHTLLE
jgi:hypothetical protein